MGICSERVQVARIWFFCKEEKEPCVMIQLFFSAFFCVNLLSSKAPAISQTIPAVQTGTTTSKTLLATDWEPATNWNRIEDKNSKTTYYIHQRTFSPDAGVSDKSLILVFTKGYTLSAAPEKPMGLPFTYFSSDVSTQGYNWYQNIKNGAVEVQLSVPGDLENNFSANKGTIQFRYFVLSPKFFEEKKITPVQLKALSYKKIVALLGTTE